MVENGRGPRKRAHAFEVFATDVNNLFVTDSFLGYATAVKARIMLKKPHPVFGFVNGKAAYGIRRVRFMAEIVASMISFAEAVREIDPLCRVAELGVGDVAPACYDC